MTQTFKFQFMALSCEMQNAKCEMQNAECKMQNAECKMQNAECKIDNCPLSIFNCLSLLFVRSTIQSLPLERGGGFAKGKTGGDCLFF